MEASDSKIFVIATPIGNLGDFSPRALGILKAVDIIAAEDTREARKLLTHFGIIGKQLISYHDHSESEQAAKIMERLKNNPLQLALISDAGTPAVADPGYRLIKAARDAGITVHPIPGPSALTSLVSVSGLPSDRFAFIGFLPTREKAREDEIRTWEGAGIRSWVFFEATRRLKDTLGVISGIYPGAMVAIGREMTKLHEETIQQPIRDAVMWASAHEHMKGEAAVMVYLGDYAAPSAAPELLLKRAKLDFAQGATLRDLLQKYRDEGYSRQELYQILLEAKGDIGDDR